jgi:hypothetical protein
LPDGITIADLREILRANFQYDVSLCRFYHQRDELSPGTPLLPSLFSDSNLIAVVNSSLFPQKSYPKVNGAFSFRRSRFESTFFKPTLQFEPDSNSPGRISDDSEIVQEDVWLPGAWMFNDPDLWYASRGDLFPLPDDDVA